MTRTDKQVDYLIHRLEGVSQEQIDEWMKPKGGSA
jgi:hypothetical protein